MTPLLVLIACSNWPRYIHLPEDTATAVLPGTVLPPDVDWHEGNTVAFVALLPDEPGDMEGDVGLIWYDTLVGSGVDPTLADDPVLDSACGMSWDFPPEERNAYLGQTHWYALRPETTGTLCATATFDTAAVTVDLLVYDISTCLVPRGPWEDPDTSKTIGLGVAGGRAAWRIPVIEGVGLGLALSAATPDNSETEWPYGLAVSLVDRAPDGHVGECPMPPLDVQ